jgi:hypothetical protein
MRGGEGGHLTLGAASGVSYGFPSPALPAAIFPLPGGRGVAGGAWTSVAPVPPAVSEEPAPAVSTADRRRRVARRRSLGPTPPAPSGGHGDVPLAPLEALATVELAEE